MPFEAASAKNGSRPPQYTERYWLGHRNRYRYRYRKEKEGQKIQETIWKSGKLEWEGLAPPSFPDVPDFLIHFSLKVFGVGF